MENMDELIEYLEEKEAETNELCKGYLMRAKGIMDCIEDEPRASNNFGKVNTLIQDFNYAQGQRNLCRIILRHYLGVKEGVTEPEYELLGKED